MAWSYIIKSIKKNNLRCIYNIEFTDGIEIYNKNFSIDAPELIDEVSFDNIILEYARKLNKINISLSNINKKLNKKVNIII